MFNQLSLNDVFDKLDIFFSKRCFVFVALSSLVLAITCLLNRSFNNQGALLCFEIAELIYTGYLAAIIFYCAKWGWGGGGGGGEVKKSKKARSE